MGHNLARTAGLEDRLRAALTTEGSSQYPVWSADGTRIAYRGTRAGSRNLYGRRVDGTSTEERLTTSPHVQMPWSISRDDRMLAFVEEAEGGMHVSLLSLLDGATRVLIREGASNTKSKISPDGRLIAYVAESQRARVYGGMHYPSSSHRGAILGRQVGRFLTRHFMRQSKP